MASEVRQRVRNVHYTVKNPVIRNYCLSALQCPRTFYTDLDNLICEREREAYMLV